MALSVAEQAKQVEREWPTFRTIECSPAVGRWEGYLRPNAKRYRVEIALFLQGRELSSAVVPNPRIKVLQDLRRRPDRRSLPHIYPNRTDPKRPYLCLFLPQKQEWHVGLSIADRLIPWTISWLVCYEAWLVTGEWSCGGIEHGNDRSVKPVR